MSTLQERLARLRRYTALVRGRDKSLAAESADLGRTDILTEGRGPESVEAAIVQESIVLARERPVLAIRDNQPQLVFVNQADSEIWRQRLQLAGPRLEAATRAVGRIELQGGRLDWVGTGWLVADSIIVTNRHVAEVFAQRKGQGFSFRIGDDGLIGAAVDFLEEIDNPASLVFRLLKPLHIEDAPGPDLAFFEVEISAGNSRLAAPITLAARPAATVNAATIGYPAYDSRIPDTDLMESIYGRVYNKKRLAPGGVTRVQDQLILHDCTTLGGNSGSVVLDLDSGQALGLHFSGSFMTTNYAVRADVVKQRLADVRAGRVRPATPPRPAAHLVRETQQVKPGPGGSATVLIPLTVTVTIGSPTQTLAASVRHTPLPVLAGNSGGDDIVDTEAVAEDYRDRGGYESGFLGEGFEVALPVVKRHAADVLKVDSPHSPELRYEHYSVLMSHSRRMCFFSAVNIDGGLSRKTRRSGWRWDPRLPKSQQIMQECYGPPPRFSRGHMTRREDPAWGDPETAQRGSDDSMHVTNTTPQMQAFNSPIWLELEDHALGHARVDSMKISVFTGPHFHASDPMMYGVQIPIAFWKVIAFIHDETGELCATGYLLKQQQSLQREQEFVFGAFESTRLKVAAQVPIRWIEARTGISFGALRDVDPFASNEEGVEDDDGPLLQTLDDVQFLR